MRKLLKPKLTTLVVTLLLFVFQSVAQNRVVTGTVSDQNGKGIPGVTVSVKGTTNATQTDASGTYRLNAPETGTLVFTSVGYGTMELPLGSGNSLDATLTAANSNLDEVVVIGYGTARKRDLTGSVATVNEKDFNKGTFISPDQLIQGKVSGVVIVQNNGAPGAAATIKIRGNSAVTGSGNPLFVVDGVPLDGRSPKPGGRDVGVGGSPASNPLSFLNPADIASIDVLKDASATAIYGSRAAYGVVLITTKRGKSGQPQIDFGASYGISSVMRRIEVLDAQQFREALTYYGLSNANDKGSDVDAFDEITRKAPVQNYNVGISGGTENARYRFSLGALNQQGVVKKSGIKKYTANLNTQFKFLPNKNFGVDFNIIPSHYSEDMAPITNNAGSRGSLIGNALQWNPTENMIVKKANGEDSLNVVRGGDLINPLALQEAYDDNSKVTQVLASISPYFKFTSWLEYRFLYSANYSTGTRRTSVQQYFNIADLQDKGFARIGGTELFTQQMTHTLNLNRDIAKNLRLNALLGFEYMDFKNKGYDMGGFGQTGVTGGYGSYGLDYTNYIQYSVPTTRFVGSYSDPTTELQSYFARAILNFKDKFLVTGTVRRDGSSKFGKDNKYGTFPSFAVAWNIFKEDFFKVDAINSLKIRAGWGKTGNQEFPAGASVQRYSFTGDGSGGLTNNNFANDQLKWQADRQFNIGIDLSVFKNRLNITADYFDKNTTDLLFPTEPAQPASPGGVVTWKNLDGEIANSGFEISLNSGLVQTNDFGLDLTVNAAFLTNEVSGLSSAIKTGTLSGQGSTGATVQTIRNGLPINAFFTREFTGIDKATGLATYTDVDVLSYVGDPNPHTLLGATLSARYKKLMFTVNMNGAFGHDIYVETYNNVINVGSINNGKNIGVKVYENPVKESFANPVTASSRFLEKGNHMKLTNATISYGLGTVAKVFKAANIYVTGQNLFVITNFSGFDPEVNVDKNVDGVPSVGIEYIPYPTARVITFGVNFSF